MTCPRAFALLLLILGIVGCSPSADAPMSGGDAGDPRPAKNGGVVDRAAAEKGDAVFQARCASCHKRTDVEGPGLMGAPSMQSGIPALRERLAEATYRAKVDQLKVVNPDYYQGKREKLEAVLAAESSQRLATFLRIYLDDPKFDNPTHKMFRPVGITESEIATVIPYLLTFQR